ncbi:MAG: hypothetical protein H7279_07060 [Microbacteriaceae bacterium]|nr:hypothetical protein [Microbacteriaceae bacterium]
MPTSRQPGGAPDNSPAKLIGLPIWSTASRTWQYTPLETIISPISTPITETNGLSDSDPLPARTKLTTESCSAMVGLSRNIATK